MTESLSRRELQKQATRGELTRAAIQLSREHGVDAVTVDMVAERVGVSRRTFFNYFPTLEHCLVATFTEVLEKTVLLFDSRPTDEPILESAAHAFTEAISTDLAGDVFFVMDVASRTTRLTGTHHEQWQQAQDQIRDLLRRRIPDADELWLLTRAAGLVGVASATLQYWAETSPDHPIDQRLTRLRDLFSQSLSSLADTFIPGS